MNGDGSGAPPWGPADPVPDLEDTQAIPGLGSVPGLGEPGGSNGSGSPAGDGRAANGAGYDGFGGEGETGQDPAAATEDGPSGNSGPER